MYCIDRQIKGVFVRVCVCKCHTTYKIRKEIVAIQYRTVNKVVIYKSVDFVDQQEPPNSIQHGFVTAVAAFIASDKL